MNERPLETDVLVVGGGPGGAAAAYYLARHGLDVTVVDTVVVPSREGVRRRPDAAQRGRPAPHGHRHRRPPVRAGSGPARLLPRRHDRAPLAGALELARLRARDAAGGVRPPADPAGRRRPGPRCTSAPRPSSRRSTAAGSRAPAFVPPTTATPSPPRSAPGSRSPPTGPRAASRSRPACAATIPVRSASPPAATTARRITRAPGSSPGSTCGKATCCCRGTGGCSRWRAAGSTSAPAC